MKRQVTCFNLKGFVVATVLLAACAAARVPAKSTISGAGTAVVAAINGAAGEGLVIDVRGRQLKQDNAAQEFIVNGLTTRPVAPEGGYFPLPAGVAVKHLTAAQHALIAYVEKFYNIQQKIAQQKLHTVGRYRHVELHWVRTVSALQGRWFTAGLPGPFLKPARPIPVTPAHFAKTALHISQEYGNLKAHVAQQWIHIGIEWVNNFRHIRAEWDRYHLHARQHWFHLVGASIPFPPDALKQTDYHLDQKAYEADARVPCPACDSESSK